MLLQNAGGFTYKSCRSWRDCNASNQESKSMVSFSLTFGFTVLPTWEVILIVLHKSILQKDLKKKKKNDRVLTMPQRPTSSIVGQGTRQFVLSVSGIFSTGELSNLRPMTANGKKKWVRLRSVALLTRAVHERPGNGGLVK